ncbi:MAG TPA: type VII secretion protein EccCa [Micromonosporaceae bacterium]
MSTEVIRRPTRRAAPPLPTGDVPIEAPPAIPQPTGVRWQQYLMMLPMLAGTVASAMMFGGREGTSGYTYVVGGIFGLSTLGMLVMNIGSANAPRKAELMGARRDYLRYLSGLRRQVRSTVIEQRAALHYRHPDPQLLWGEAMSRRVWERRAADADFGVVRIGVGAQSLATPLVPPAIDPTTDLEPVTAGALHRFLTTYAVVPDLPISIAVRAFARVFISDREVGGAGGRALARALVGQLATFHAPEDLLVAACVAPEHRREWEWLKWLPHAQHPTEHDAIGPRRLVTSAPSELDDLLADLLGHRSRSRPAGRGADPATTPHIVVIVDGGEPGAAVAEHPDAVTVVQIGGTPVGASDRDTIAFTVAPDGALRSATAEGEREVGRADWLSVVEADALARRLAPLRLSGAAREEAPLSADRDLAELLGLPDIATADPAVLWSPRSEREHLRIPIGTGPDGEAIHLDLKEAAQDGMGPHGMVVGATGSGKSELLRTLVLGLAATHSSETLNFVLIDFKGGATFASLDRLPHTSAVITNLADRLSLVDRMHDALTGELTRRQEVLRHAGQAGFASLRDYDRARAAGAPLPPLPSLLIVCDEFTELLIAKPEFIDIFLQIGRIGRSIGVHLLLATQRLEEGRLRGLDANLSYRIALRTFSTLESRSLIGNTDAANLPATPGHAFLAVGTETPQRFRAAYVSGPYRRRTPASAPVALRMYEYATAPVAPPAALPAPEGAPRVAAPSAPERATPSLMEVIVGRLAGHGTPAHQVWLPPLREPATLDELLGGVRTDAHLGLASGDAALHGKLSVPVAMVDRPLDQRREVAWLDLAGAAGHVAIAGGPQSGKSTLVRTLVTALALTHTAAQVQVYCLDFGGGGLGGLRELPHVGGVAGRLDRAQVRRTVGEVAALLADRERAFAAHGIDSMAAYRRLPSPGEDSFGDVFLVIDGWATVRAEFEDLEPVVADIATRGLSYGVHLVATATRWYDLRQNVKDLFGSKVELRLGDPADSIVNRKLAANVPAGVPGRGLTADGLHLLTALPQAAGRTPAELVGAIAAAWHGPAAPPVRMLPTRVPYDELLVSTQDGGRVPVGTGLELPIGIAEADLRPVLLDFAADPHLLIFGDECGKSSLLRSLADSIVRRFTPRQARIILIDYRRSLLGAITTEHLIGYGIEVEHTSALISSATSYLDERRPGPEVTPEQLRSRSWWDGPELFVLVDDYDLVAAGGRNPVQPLVEYLTQARDVGLHLVLARRAGGAGRALFDPVVQRLRELGSPGVIMSGDRDEGVLVGNVRPSVQPPGRGYLYIRRHGTRLVQLAYLEPATT